MSWLLSAMAVGALALGLFSGLRGRLAGIEMISYLTGPLIGNAPAGFMADAWGVSPAIWVGRVVCLVGVIATGFALPIFWAYRSSSGGSRP